MDCFVFEVWGGGGIENFLGRGGFGFCVYFVFSYTEKRILQVLIDIMIGRENELVF